MPAVTEATRLELRLAEQTVPARLALPDGPGPHPGVLVIHELWGLTADIERICERLATAGYAALAAELYGPGPRPLCVARAIRDLKQAQGEQGMGRAAAALEALRARPEVDASRTGAIGFCMGGGFALLLAPGHGFAAASVNYGIVPKDAASLLAGSCPVVGSFGRRDLTLRGAARRLDSALTGAGVPHDVKEYPGAGHGFLNDHDGAGDKIPFVVRLGSPVMGYGPHEEAARDARRRIVAFFRTHLHAG
jgi:carboxymethylenebutenolidase